MTDTTLEVRTTTAPTFLPGEHESGRIWKLAQTIAATDFVPRGLRGNPPAIMAAMLTGRELGIMPMRALRQVNVIDGQPSPSPELMMALALKAGHEVDVVETSRTRCIVEVRRAEWSDDRRRLLEWTIDDAVAAGLCTVTADGEIRARSKSGQKLPWEAYTRAMLRSRAVSEACRTWLPDVVDGASYVPEELGAPVTRDGHAQELVDAADARGDTYDPLEGEPDDVRAAVAHAMAANDADPDDDEEVVDAEVIDDPDRNVHLRNRIRTALHGMSADHPDYPTIWQQLVDILGGHGWGPTDDDLWPNADPDQLAELAGRAEQAAEQAKAQRDAPPEPDTPTPPDGTPDDTDDAEPYDWRRHAAAHNVRVGQIVGALCRDWPTNSQWNKPSRSADLDQLSADPVKAPILQATIDDLAGGGT